LKTDPKKWSNWQWQEQNRLRNGSDIKSFFPRLSDNEVKTFNEYASKYKLGITPYLLSLIKLNKNGLPLTDDPVWNQFKYFSPEETSGPSDYDSRHENWEIPGEMPTPMIQHKYPGRAIIRLVNSCLGYCNYCYLTTRIIDKKYSSRKQNNGKIWSDTLSYLRKNPDITDVLISGGDPLLLSNSRLEQVFRDLKSIKSIRSIRLNTRALTHNPYRFDAGLVKIFKKYNLTVLEIHMSHPVELTGVVKEKLSLFDKAGYRPIIVWRAPLLKGINDDEKTLTALFNALYENRIIPYYLFHYAPYTLGRSTIGVSVKAGARIMQKIRRKVPGIAFPRYTLFHVDGKHDIPLEPSGTPGFVYKNSNNNNPVIKFKNWKQRWVTYQDIKDAPCRRKK